MDESKKIKQTKDSSLGSTRKNSPPSVLTPPSEEEERYLREIEKASGRYDPEVVVGGPKRYSA